MSDDELARAWILGLTADPEDAVSLAALLSRVRREEANRALLVIQSHGDMAEGQQKNRIQELEQAAGGSAAAGSEK